MKNVHSSAVVLMVVCPVTQDVVSVGNDRRIAVYREKASGLGLVLAGGIDEVRLFHSIVAIPQKK